MPRLYRKAKSKRPEVDPAVWAWLVDENEDERDEAGGFSWPIFKLSGEWLRCHGGEGDQLRELWESVADDVLDYFVGLYPGHRPKMWWRYSAPRVRPGTEDDAAETFLAGKLAEPRLQVSGAGAPPWQAGLAYMPTYEFGIPSWWHGFDPADPPTFESEANYLRRLKLLLPGEERKLTAEDFESEEVDIPEC